MQTSASQEVPCDKWMEWFLGASELDLIKNKGKFMDEKGRLKNAKNGALWAAGDFDQLSVAALKQEVQSMTDSRPNGQTCPLRVIDSTDIGAYQATFRTDDKVMVQIASNMHCLENGNPNCSADHGRLVEGYCVDCTQGPAAAFGVPGASLVRAHYAFREKYVDDASLWGQSSDRQINLLEDICKNADTASSDPYFVGNTINGKAQLLGNETHVTPELIDDVASNIKVGLHSDSQVVFTRGSNRRHIKVLEEPQFIDQLCTATLCYGFFDRNASLPNAAKTHLTQAILRASYEGTYLAAIKRGTKKLLLTLIGGASFSNPHSMILDELKRAHDLYACHPSSQLEEVQLVLFDQGVAHKYQKRLDERGVGAR